MRKLQWRPRAHLDRESIALHLGVERGNPQAALKVMQSIDEALELVLSSPEIGKRFAMGNDGSREYRRIRAGSYIIFYVFDSETVTVFRVLHQRQNIDTCTLVDL